MSSGQLQTLHYLKLLDTDGVRMVLPPRLDVYRNLGSDCSDLETVQNLP